MSQNGMHVLVIDDLVDAADSMVELLSCWGYPSEAQYVGSEGLASAALRPPAIVLLDIGMPGINGFEFATRLRGIRNCENVEIVAISGFTGEAHRARARAAGIRHYLDKPADPIQLYALVARLMAPAPSVGQTRRKEKATFLIGGHVLEPVARGV